VEKRHEERYRKLLKNIEDGTVFNKGKKVKWVCRHCGFVYEGEKPPKNCPACEHPQAYFEEMAENF